VHLLKLKKLKSIILNGPKMTAAWHGNLSTLPLESLSVSQGNALPAAQAIAGARSIPTLRRFAVDGRTLTDADLTALASMTQLESLSLGDIDLPASRSCMPSHISKPSRSFATAKATPKKRRPK